MREIMIKKVLKHTGAFFCIIITLAILFGLAFVVPEDYEYWGQNSKQTDGKIVGLETEVSDQGPIEYPIIEFSTENNEKHRFTSRASLSVLSGYNVNDTINVRYSPDDPSFVFVQSGFSSLTPKIIAAILGLATLFFGIVLIRSSRNLIGHG